MRQNLGAPQLDWLLCNTTIERAWPFYFKKSAERAIKPGQCVVLTRYLALKTLFCMLHLTIPGP